MLVDEPKQMARSVARQRIGTVRVHRARLRLALALMMFSICSTVVPLARADSACNCGGSSLPSCREICPTIIDGDCSGGVVGAKCGANDFGECWPGKSGCPPRAAGTKNADAGMAMLNCQVYEDCALDASAGGCRLGADEASTRRQVALPAVLIASGILLLIVERRYRRRSQR
jgi:hypothetical protein